jgi:hypothetical protein
MQKTILLAFATMLWAGVLQGQLSGLGLQIGANYGSPIGKVANGAKGKLGAGLIAGMYGRFRLTDRIAVQTELRFSLKKSSFFTPISGDTTIQQEVLPGVIVPIATYYNGTVEGSFNNLYFEMPVLASIRLGHRLDVLVGAYISYLAHGANEGLADIVIGNNFRHDVDVPFDQSEFLSNVDYGAVLGGQYEIFQGINLGLRFSSGLRSVYKSSYTAVDGSVPNVYLQATLGYTFGEKLD